MTSSFPVLLRQQRERQGLSQNRLARLIGVSPSTVNMLEGGLRGATRQLVVNLAGALELSSAETDELLLAANHLPTAYDRLGRADPDLEIVVGLLSNEAIPSEKRQQFRSLIRAGASLCGYPSASSEVTSGH